MATNQVTFTTNISDFSTGILEHTLTFYHYSRIMLAFKITDFTTVTTADSDIIIPLNIPKSAVITSMVFPIEFVITPGDFTGVSFTLVVENIEYELDSNGNVIDTKVYSHLNNYKTQYGMFPNIILHVHSWSNPREDENDKRNHAFFIYQPKITCLFDGGETVLRPCADVSVGHEIMEGFSGVYQLINEEEADDSTTYIGSFAEFIKETEVNDLRTSIVKLDSITETAKLIYINMFLVGTAFFDTTSGEDDSYAKCEMYLEIDGVTSSSVCIFDDILNQTTHHFNHAYVLNSEDEFVQAINNYYNKNGVMPEIKAHLSTNCHHIPKGSKASGSGAKAQITQAYVQVIYEGGLATNMNIHHKVNGVWKPATKAYQKQGGTWIEITEEECKTILKSHLITK